MNSKIDLKKTGHSRLLLLLTVHSPFPASFFVCFVRTGFSDYVIVSIKLCPEIQNDECIFCAILVAIV